MILGSPPPSPVFPLPQNLPTQSSSYISISLPLFLLYTLSLLFFTFFLSLLINFNFYISLYIFFIYISFLSLPSLLPSPYLSRTICYIDRYLYDGQRESSFSSEGFQCFSSMKMWNKIRVSSLQVFVRIHMEYKEFSLKVIQPKLQVIRKFLLNHKKSFRWHLGDYEKHFFFLFEGL